MCTKLQAESPEREVQKNPDVVRNDEQIEDENEVLKKSNTTAKMLSLFRQMEETRETVPDGEYRSAKAPHFSHHLRPLFMLLNFAHTIFLVYLKRAPSGLFGLVPRCIILWKDLLLTLPHPMLPLIVTV